MLNHKLTNLLFVGSLAFAGFDLHKELFYVRKLVYAVVIDGVSRCLKLATIVPIAEGEWCNSKNLGGLLYGYEFYLGYIHKII